MIERKGDIPDPDFKDIASCDAEREVTEWAWRDPATGFTVRRVLGGHYEVLTRTYVKGSTPPDWTVVDPDRLTQ